MGYYVNIDLNESWAYYYVATFIMDCIKNITAHLEMGVSGNLKRRFSKSYIDCGKCNDQRLLTKAVLFYLKKQVNAIGGKIKMENINKWKIINFGGWIFTIGSILLTVYSFCSFRFFFIWNVSPSRIYILGLALIAFVLGIIGAKSRRNKISSVFTILLSLGLIFILLLSMSVYRITKMETIQSPNKQYKVSFYSTDAGAGSETPYLGYIDGPLWFKKRFYTAGIKDAPIDVTWKNNFTIKVNNHLINLKQGQIYNH